LFESPKATSGYWITVFGFSVSNKDEILSKFTHMVSYCDIREAGPNWAHICFSDPTDYHRALLFNGHVTNNGSMIGVIPCNDKVIFNGNTKCLLIKKKFIILIIILFRQFQMKKSTL